VAVKRNPDATLDVKLIDLDELALIKESTDQGSTAQESTGKCYVRLHAITHIEPDDVKIQFIEHMAAFTAAMFHAEITPTLIKVHIPNAVADNRYRIIHRSRDYFHIIDLCSWCYAALEMLAHTTITNMFTYHGLFAIVMNMLIPNYDVPNDPPVDARGVIINAQYCANVMYGIKVLLEFQDANRDLQTMDSVSTFLSLVQKPTELAAWVGSSSSSGGSVASPRKKTRRLRKKHVRTTTTKHRPRRR
jgi:hypothetical protein